MNKKRKATFVIIVLNLICLVIIGYNIRELIVNGDFKNKSNFINYTIVSYKENSGGKGNHYNMDILYEGNTSTLSITRKEYEEIKQKVYPKVYETSEGNLITDWIYEQRKRIIYSIGFLFMFLNLMFYLDKKHNDL